MAAVLYDLISHVLTSANALSLTIDGTAVTSDRRKQLAFLEGIDPLPFLIVACGGPEKVQPFATEGYQQVDYLIRIGLFSQGNRDSKANEADIELAREQLRKIFQVSTGYPSGTLMVRVANEDPSFLPPAYPVNLDLSIVTGRVTVIEEN